MGTRNKMTVNKKQFHKAFTIIELLVTISIFAILLSGVIGVFSAISRTSKLTREKTILSSFASNYLEIVRNMPYSKVGTIVGNPSGNLPDLSNPKTQIIGSTTYKIYYEVVYIDDPADGTALAGTDPYPADYKQIKMDILNTSNGQTTSFFTNVVPLGLEGTTSQGALKISVIDASGNPLVGANIHITYPTTTPTLILDRSTDSTGQWVEVGLTPAVNNYNILVTKPGYSQDQTYPITNANPNPYHPDATIAQGVVTSITFSIDLLANLNIKTLDALCGNISGVNLNVKGAKLIGTATSSPPSSGLYKFNNNYSSVNGLIALSNIEWDTYTPTLLSGQSWVIYGTSPIQKIDVLPGTTQTFSMILGINTTANSLLVVVKDAASGTALEGATVHLQKGGSTPQDFYGITGGSVWLQSDWTGGGGVSQWSSTTPSQYFQSDGNVDANSAPTGLRLNKISGHYVASGWLESSTFDSGTAATNYSILSWQPSSQSVGTILQVQVAANNDNATWNYIGPDGTTATYFTTPGTDMGSALDNNRYVRYKVFLSTSNNNKTPVLTSLNLNFVTGCFTPGQVVFTGLTAGNNYNLDVSLSGYQTQSINSLNINGNQSLQILMSP
jgi:prepilin-type N-terminal cleavage/methylation domain-containing protein